MALAYMADIGTGGDEMKEKEIDFFIHHYNIAIEGYSPLAAAKGNVRNENGSIPFGMNEFAMAYATACLKDLFKAEEIIRINNERPKA